MALIIPPGYLQAVYVMSFAGDSEPMVTTCGHEIDTASGATGAEAPSDLFNAFALTLLAQCTSDVTLQAVDVYVGQDGPGTVVYSSDNTPVTGSGTADSLPPNSAILIRKRTDLGGRRGRGRMYIPGVMRSQVDDNGKVNPAQVDNWNNAGLAFMDKLTTAVGARYYPPVVLHRSEGIGTEPVPTPIVSFVCDSVIATQRRRLRP